MNCTSKIVVSEHFNHNTLVTREVATRLMDIIRDVKWYDIEVDFAGIHFISRSFADQFHKEKLELWKSGKKNIIVVNAQYDVYSMFKAVSRTQEEVFRVHESYPVIQFYSRRSLRDYLQSVL